MLHLSIMREESLIRNGESTLKCELAGEVLRSFGALRFAATGWSMLPSIWPGETLIVERVSDSQVRIGDIVLVGREGGLCAHRVVGSEGDRWITQGDALARPDRPVSGDEVLGRVVYVIRRGKCVSLPSELSVFQSLIAKIARHSFSAARAIVYLNRIRQPLAESI